MWEDFPSSNPNIPKCAVSVDSLDLQFDDNGCGIWEEIIGCETCSWSAGSCDPTYCKTETCGSHSECVASLAGKSHSEACWEAVSLNGNVTSCMSSTPINRHWECFANATPAGCKLENVLECSMQVGQDNCGARTFCTWEAGQHCDEQGLLKEYPSCGPNWDALIPAVLKSGMGLWVHDVWSCSELTPCTSNHDPATARIAAAFGGSNPSSFTTNNSMSPAQIQKPGDSDAKTRSLPLAALAMTLAASVALQYQL